jgi:glycosyltransferase involved in cell wall biosynthesis
LLIVETTGIRAIPPSQTCPAKTILWDKSPPTELGVIGHLQRLYWSRVWRKHSQRASYYLFQSEEHRQFMEARFPLSHGESIVFENGVDVGKFSLPESEPDPNVLVYAGMVSRTRGIPQLIRSCKAIYKEKPNLRLHILGRGEYLSKAKGEMRKNPWLQVHGFIEDEAEFKGIFNSAGVGVIPHPDYFWWQICAPLKLFEYAASGKTVAAISMPCHDKYGDQKWFCVGDEGNTVESLTSSINSAIESSGDPNNRKLARSFAEENFTFETNLRDLIDRISSI